MRVAKNNIFHGIDPVLVLLYLMLVLFGWMNIYAATYTEDTTTLFNLNTYYGKHLFRIGVGFTLCILVLFFNAKTYEKFASVIYLISLTSLVTLFIFGNEINGAKSWFNFGGLSIQPSEFAKFATALALAKLLNERQYNLKLFKNQLKALIIIFLPALLITLQPDPGSALIYTCFFFVLSREGLPIYYIAVGTTAIIIFIITLAFGYYWVLIVCYSLLLLFVIYLQFYRKISLKFHLVKIFNLFAIVGLFIVSVDYIYNHLFEQRHRDRFNILLGEKTDLRGIGYNSNQSVITIKSGGAFGKGYLQGDRTKGDFVPEQHTDYIFSTIGEEWGFVGASLVILVFTAFVLRIIHLAERQKTTFSRIYGYGIAAVFFFHYLINIGMVIGLFPTIGIPLPFFSYGGSALWGFTILLFIFIKLDASRSYEL